MKPEFKAFSKIAQIGKLFMNITQKIHGTNAQICVYKTFSGDLDLVVGSRSRWIYPGDDNYNFAQHVHAHKQEFIDKLGPGFHFGEWAGPGINSGEGLTDRTFVLFDFWRWPAERALPPQTKVVPVLYQGPVDFSRVEVAMADLKTNGSRLAPGFMRPEGIVVSLAGERFKKVFQAEDSAWQRVGDGGKDKLKALSGLDYSHLLQPIRLEKLLSRDEAFLRNYPKSLPEIIKAYFEDLVEEGQIAGDVDELKAIRKGASPSVFNFVKTQVNR